MQYIARGLTDLVVGFGIFHGRSGRRQSHCVCQGNEDGRLGQSDPELALQSPNNVLGFGRFRRAHQQLFDFFNFPLLRLIALGLGNFSEHRQDFLDGKSNLGLLFAGSGKESPERLLFTLERLCHRSQVSHRFVLLLDHVGVGSGRLANGSNENGIANSEFDAFVGRCHRVAGQVQCRIQILIGLEEDDLSKERGHGLLNFETTGNVFNLSKGLTENGIGQGVGRLPRC